MTEREERKKQKAESVHLPFWGIPKIWRFIRPYSGIYFLLVAMMLLVGVIDILMPRFQEYAINHFIGGETLEGIWLFAGAYFLTLALQVTMNLVGIYQANRVEMYVGRDMKRACFNHLQTLSFSYFNRNSVGYLHSRVMSDTSRIGGVLAWDTVDGVWNLTYMLGASVVMLLMNWKLALCVLIIVPLLSIASAFFQGRLVFLNRKIRETNSQISGKFNDGIVGISSVRTLGIEDKVADEFRETTEQMRRYSDRAGHFRALFRTVISGAASVALALVLWRGGLIALTAEDLGAVAMLSVFMTYAQGMMEPVQWLVNAISDLITVQVNIERTSKLLETESDVTDRPEVIEKYGDVFSPKRENWESIRGDVTFADVSFRYPDGNEYVLEHFNLDVPAGTTVAIVGETGAGKSTLVNLVCRFYEPTAGKILIDGWDVRDRAQIWLHSQIGYVLQTPHLFSGSVAENLRYGNTEATEEEMWQALRLISADKVVERMGQGLQSDVGEGGDSLSTGEKQLLSFARVLLADPRIFVLDEATSSVDSETERLIQNATETVMRGRTSFVIAHRLSTIRNADVILAVRGGKIVESGTHDALMAQKGYYYTLYTRQFEDEQTKKTLDNA